MTFLIISEIEYDSFVAVQNGKCRRKMREKENRWIRAKYFHNQVLLYLLQLH